MAQALNLIGLPAARKTRGHDGLVEMAAALFARNCNTSTSSRDIVDVLGRDLSRACHCLDALWLALFERSANQRAKVVNRTAQRFFPGGEKNVKN